MTETQIRNIPKDSRLIAFVPSEKSPVRLDIGFDSLTLPEKVCVRDIALGTEESSISSDDRFADAVKAANVIVRMGRVSTTLAPLLYRARQIKHYDVRVDWAGDEGYAHLVVG